MTDTAYVVAGAWIDKAWQQAAANRNTATHDDHAALTYSMGPRTHPYGVLAFTVVVDGEPRIYPSKAAAEKAGVLPPEEVPTPEPDPAPVKPVAKKV